MVDEVGQQDEVHLRGWALVLLDSGACMHVAPRWFAAHAPLYKAPDISLRTASGAQLQVDGVRDVELWARSREGQAVKLTIRFAICDVKAPILSVGAAMEKGMQIDFGSLVARGPDGQAIDLVKRATRFYLAVGWSKKEALLNDGICPVETAEGVVDTPEGEAGVEISVDGPEGPWDERRAATEMNAPILPSDEVVRAHNLTHLPFAAWCKLCVEGRGQEAAHYRRVVEPSVVPVLAADYHFFSARAEELPVDTSTCLAMVCHNTSYLGAALVPQKGVHPHAVRAVQKFMDELGYVRVMWQTDGEPSIVALIRSVRRELGKSDGVQKSVY